MLKFEGDSTIVAFAVMKKSHEITSNVTSSLVLRANFLRSPYGTAYLRI